MHKPLVTDLDGTLIFTDLLHESVIRLLKTKPYLVFLLPFWLLKGRANLKRELAKRIDLDFGSLPFNQPLLLWLKEQKTAGRKLILCTASDQIYADAVAKKLNIFDAFHASDGQTNIASIEKAKLLTSSYGAGNFDYVGNSKADIPVWHQANQALIVSASKSFVEQINGMFRVSAIFEAPKMSFLIWIKMLRIHQWLKNALIFVPLLAAHQLSNMESWVTLSIGFLSFSFCASSVYLVNDLFDLSDDRRHPRKRYRPFASGAAPLWLGCLLAPTLLVLSFGLATAIDGPFLFWLAVYFCLTCLYSWGLKRMVMVDCFVLAILYTLRILAGGAAIDIPLSTWLLAFSIFFFLSLAFLKRYVELLDQPESADRKVHGRGYFVSDIPLVSQIGICAGFASVLVLALYLNSQIVVTLYTAPQLIWLAIPVLLFWMSWMWLKAHRGEMHDDPLMFAVRDVGSISLGCIFISIFFLASIL
jgi:4-hydroxybenzoate polyprenyltransferase